MGALLHATVHPSSDPKRNENRRRATVPPADDPAMAYTPGENDVRRVEQKPRRLRPDRAQYRSLRNAIWLSAIELGLPVVADGAFRPVDTTDLARLWEVTPQSIRNGLRAAIADRRALASARSADA